MPKRFDEILDECMNRINHGEKVKDCLASYPEYAGELEPLLQAMLDAQKAYTFVPSATAKRAARQRFNAAREELQQKREERQPLFPWLLGWARVGAAVAAVAAVLLIALIGYFGLKPTLFPMPPSPQPSPEGNFVFLISDDVNAIGDFQSLDISVSKIGLHLEGEDSQWIELNPEVEVVDLTLLQGDKAQEIWRGDVPEGQYTKVFIYVSNVSGILRETGKLVDVKLPSEKLHISKPFEITSSSVTSFVYDITVVAAGSSQSGIKYILKPQVGQSGAD